MKYSEKVYVGALTALEMLRQSVSESKAYTIDFMAEAVAEKGDRDHPKTNGDRIRGMSNEELAVFLAKTRADVCRSGLPVVTYRGAEVNDNLDWLSLELNEEWDGVHAAER